jgi:hypothetical protein
MTTALPSGGACNLDPRIAEIYLAHLEITCAPEGSRKEREARKRKKALLAGLTWQQRSYAISIARVLALTIQQSGRSTLTGSA